MDQTIYKGTISFIHHDKQYATIDYEQDGKKKTINFKTDQKEPAQQNDKKKKTHRFRIGDEVNFQIKLSDRGDRMIAYAIKFLYNTELEKLVNRAKIENRFAGYLKQVDDQLFVKERDSYIFFPLRLSKWERPPAESAFNETISFKLVNFEKPQSIAAELFSHDYTPSYRKAIEHYKSKTPVEGIVSRVSPFAVYLDLFGGDIQAKLELPEEMMKAIKEGDTLKVGVTHIGPQRIVVEVR